MKRIITAAAGLVLGAALSVPASAGSYHTHRSLDAQVGYGSSYRGERFGYHRRGYRARGYGARVGFGFGSGYRRGYDRPDFIEHRGARRGYTKFCSDDIRWSGHVGVRRCVLVRHDLLGRYRARYH